MKPLKELNSLDILSSSSSATSKKADVKEGIHYNVEERKLAKKDVSKLVCPIVNETIDKELQFLSAKLSVLKKLHDELTNEEATFSMPDRLPWNVSTETVTNLNDDLTILDSEYVTVNQSTFTNNLGTTQIWKIPAFSCSVDNSISTTKMNVTDMLTTVDTEVKIPFRGGLDVPPIAIHDCLNSKTMKTTTETWTIASQDVDVASGQTVRVEWLAVVCKATGTIDLDLILQGIIPHGYHTEDSMLYGYSIDNSLKEYDQLSEIFPFSKDLFFFDSNMRNKWKITGNGKAARTFGRIKYEIKQNLEIMMNFYEVKDTNDSTRHNDRLIETRIFSADKLCVKAK